MHNPLTPIAGLKSEPLCGRYAAAVFSTAFTRAYCADGLFEQSVHWALGCLRDGDRELLGAWSQPDLGADLPAGAFVDLAARGVESIGFVLGGDSVDIGADAESGMQVAALGMTRMPSIEQILTVLLMQVAPRHRGAMAGALRAVVAAGGGKAVDAARTAFEHGRWGTKYPEIAMQWRFALAQWAPVFALSAPLRRVVLSADATADKLHGSLVRAIGRQGCFASQAEALNFVASALSRAERRLERVRTRAATESRPCRSATTSRPSALGVLSP